MKQTKKQFLYFLLFFAFFSAKAQDPVFRVLDYEAGLPSNSVYSIMQDSRGYIWIGHDKGLSRYDGLSFEHFSNNVIQSRALSNLEEDKDGRVWCQNFSGELFYAMDRTLFSPDKLGATGNYIPFVIYRGAKVITTRNGKLVQYDITKKTTVDLNIPGLNFSPYNLISSENTIYSISSDRTTIAALNDLHLSWTVKLPTPLQPAHFTASGKKLFMVPRYGSGIAGIVENGKLVKEVHLGIDAIIQNAKIIEDKLWISTTEGAYCFDLNLNILNGGKPYFRDCNISKVIQDAEGLLWFSTVNKGIYVVPNLEVKMVNLGGQSLTRCVYLSGADKIVLGTEDNILMDLNTAGWFATPFKDLGIRHDITKLYDDAANGRIFVASDKMYAIQNATGMTELSQSIPMKDITFLGGEMYAIATPEGVVLYRIKPDSTDQYFAKLFTGKSIRWVSGRQLLPGSEGRAKCVAYDAKNQILYGSSYQGLFSWSAKNKRQNFLAGGSKIYAADIAIKDGMAFVGTYKGRLIIIENGKVVKIAGEFRGLEGKSISRVQVSGNLVWLLFENSFVKYNYKTNTHSVITIADGLPNTEIKDFVIARGITYLATRAGLVVFQENLKQKKMRPRLLIEEMEVNNKEIKPTVKQIELGTNENNLEVELSVLSYRNNPGIQIFYNINDKGWVKLGNMNRVLHLVGLAPGRYEVRFKAVSVDGSEITSPQILKFRIAAPLYARWWFLLLLLLIISGLVFYFMRFRLYELKKEAEFKTAKEKLERELQISTLASIKSQMNPHFVFNALNTVQSYIFTNDRENATDYLQKFSELTRMILDMSTREKINLSEEIKALTLYLELEKRRFEDSIEYQIVVNENIAPELVQIPSMLIQPYVENAIKHGLLHKKGDRKLKVEFVKEGNAVIAFIDDNGIGRKKSQEMKALKPSSHRSFASEANKKRLQLLNQGRKNTIDIEYLDKMDSYGNSLGTMVILAIPLNF